MKAWVRRLVHVQYPYMVYTPAPYSVSIYPRSGIRTYTYVLVWPARPFPLSCFVMLSFMVEGKGLATLATFLVLPHITARKPQCGLACGCYVNSYVIASVMNIIITQRSTLYCVTPLYLIYSLLRRVTLHN